MCPGLHRLPLRSITNREPTTVTATMRRRTGQSNSMAATAIDANGNTLSDPSGKSYSWDFENRLRQAVVPALTEERQP